METERGFKEERQCPTNMPRRRARQAGKALREKSRCKDIPPPFGSPTRDYIQHQEVLSRYFFAENTILYIGLIRLSVENHHRDGEPFSRDRRSGGSQVFQNEGDYVENGDYFRRIRGRPAPHLSPGSGVFGLSHPAGFPIPGARGVDRRRRRGSRRE